MAADSESNRPRSGLLLALSGGADSVLCLLQLASPSSANLRRPLVAAYLDHGQRPDETPAEEQFCAALCRQHGVPFHGRKLTIGAGRGGFEARARRARYEALFELARDLQLGEIATGHHADDRIETLLLRWMRGTALSGLVTPRVPGQVHRGRFPGDPHIRDLAPLAVVHPIDRWTRPEILAELARRGQAYCEDSSNRSDEFARNRVRSRLLPALKAAQPGARSRLVQLQQAVEGFEQGLRQVQPTVCPLPGGGVRLELAELRDLPPLASARAVRRALLEQTGAEPRRSPWRELRAALATGSPYAQTLPGGGDVRIRGGWLEIRSARLAPGLTSSAPKQRTGPGVESAVVTSAGRSVVCGVESTRSARSARLASQLAAVRKRMESAVAPPERPTDRPAAPARLLAVTKSVQPEVAVDLVRLGQTHLGENRAPELLRKVEAVRKAGLEATWHFIGQLQRNKARRVLEVADFIHSVDRMSLLETIARLAAELDRRPRIFLEVKLAGDEAKSGFAAEDLDAASAFAAKAPHLELAGLMTMAPWFEQTDARRAAAHHTFARLAKLASDLPSGRFEDQVPKLSMGMSGDLEAAIAHGSDWIRVGTALFEGLPESDRLSRPASPTDSPRT